MQTVAIVDRLKLDGATGTSVEVSSNSVDVTIAIMQEKTDFALGVCLSPSQAREMAIKLAEMAWYY